MQLSEKQLTAFRQLYKKHFAVDLTDQQAQEKAIQLLLSVRMAYKPLPRPSSTTE